MTRAGTVITFYSYKGGVGRSMAVANVGSILARRPGGGRVLMIDWDLEAPGLYEFFATGVEDRDHQHTGVLDYFTRVRNALEADNEAYEGILERWSALRRVTPIDRYIRRDILPNLDYMPAGRRDSSYRERVNEFDWDRMWTSYPAVFHAFREALMAKYEFILVDSRTGFNDVSGICTAIMPEKLVAVFSLNKQNLDGLIDVAERSIEFRTKSDDVRPLAVFPLPSRIENAELKRKEVWLRRFQHRFEDSFRRQYDAAKDCNLTGYFLEIGIPYIPFFSCGEVLAVLTEESRAGSMLRAFQTFADRLARLDYPWQPDEEAARFRREDSMDSATAT